MKQAERAGSLIRTNCKGFPNTLDPLHDRDGHGTHVASVLRRTDPLASLYIARIADDSRHIPSDNDYMYTVEVAISNLQVTTLIWPGNWVGD
jgi:hypothetical protein